MNRINLYLDIETARLANLPGPPEKAIQRGMGNRTDPDKIAEKEKENVDKWYEQAALDRRKGQVIAIGYMDDEDDNVQQMTQHIGTESELLEWLWKGNWKTVNLIGYNIREFDVPFLLWRSRIWGLEPPKFNLARFRRDLGIFDLFDEVSQDGKLDMTGWSLAFCAEYFGLPTEPYGNGEDVAEWYATGNWGEICKHLEADVLMTRDLYNLIGY